MIHMYFCMYYITNPAMTFCNCFVTDILFSDYSGFVLRRFINKTSFYWLLKLINTREISPKGAIILIKFEAKDWIRFVNYCKNVSVLLESPQSQMPHCDLLGNAIWIHITQSFEMYCTSITWDLQFIDQNTGYKNFVILDYELQTIIQHPSCPITNKLEL